MNSEDVPLTSAFDANPLEYMQQYVRNLNNEIFLSEYHINNLYALLLIGRNSPWDDIKYTVSYSGETALLSRRKSMQWSIVR